MKQYVGLARVSSREQEREGFSLDIQEDALKRFADQNEGVIIKLFRIAETASKSDERKSFRELIRYSKKHCQKIDGLLFYKVDRAARNLFDYVELERLESEYDVPFISVSQPTETNPAGRMMRRTLANMASFYTEQQSLDVKEGLLRRVQSGLFVCRAPYGYKNIRKDGRSLIEVHETEANNIQRIFELYAYHNHTLDSLLEELKTEGRSYTNKSPHFSRGKLHSILHDRAYIGEIRYRDNWYPGIQKPIIDRPTFDRVQRLLGNHTYKSHELVYAGDMIQCQHCGSPITGETKVKKTKQGMKEYRYYRCVRYNKPNHPRVRLTEANLDQQVLNLFERIRIEDEDVKDWFLRVLYAKTRDGQQRNQDRLVDLNRQISSLRQQQDQLLNLRLMEEIDQSTFASKGTELRDRLADLQLQVHLCDQTRSDNGELAVKVFELSQTLKEKWVKADCRAKRQILEIVCLNFLLDDVTLVPTIRKPFDVLAKGLSVSLSRDDRI